MFGTEIPTGTPGQVAGKDVMILELGTGTTCFYPAGETAWYVDADEPALTEVLEALPQGRTVGSGDAP
jgi:hypothetical protein